MLYPPKGICESRSHWPPFDSLSILLCLRNGFDTFKIPILIGVFEILKMFYPPKGHCKAEPNGVHLTVFPFYCVRKGCLDLSFQNQESAFLKSRKCFINQNDSAKQNPMGSIWQSFHFVVFEKRFFQNPKSPSAFLKSWKYFIPRRDSAKHNPMGSIWQSFHFIVLGNGVWTFHPTFQILKIFHPPKGLCEAKPNGVHLTVFPFFCFRKVFWNFQNPNSSSAFLKSW